jgi:hypothetical protein
MVLITISPLILKGLKDSRLVCYFGSSGAPMILAALTSEE